MTPFVDFRVPGYSGPGRRFNVGVQTLPGSTLGFQGPTPKEKRLALAEKYGLDPQIAEIAPDDRTFQRYALESLANRQEEASRKRAGDEQFQRTLQAHRQQQAEKAQERHEKIRLAKQMKDPYTGQGPTPAEEDAAIEADVDAWLDYHYRRRTGQETERQRKAAEEAKQKRLTAQAESLTALYPAELHAQIRAAVAQGTDKRDIRSWADQEMKRLDKQRERQEKLEQAERSADQYRRGLRPQHSALFENVFASTGNAETARRAVLQQVANEKREEAGLRDRQGKEAEKAQKGNVAQLKVDWDIARARVRVLEKDAMFVLPEDVDPKSQKKRDAYNAAVRREQEAAIAYRDALGTSGAASPAEESDPYAFLAELAKDEE